MSYARFSSRSDVYVFPSVGGYVECCGCSLGDEWEFHSAVDIAQHLAMHVAAGHKVNPELLDPDFYGAEDFLPYEN